MNNFTIFLFILTIVCFSCSLNPNSKKKHICGQVPNDTDLHGPGLVSPIHIPWNAPFTRKRPLFPVDTYAGALVTPSLVLTSANYFLGKNSLKLDFSSPEAYNVRLGSQNFISDSLGASISHIQIHPGYKEGDWYSQLNSYALIHLKEPVEIGETIAPVCLPASNDAKLIQDLYSNSLDEAAILSGWNRSSNGDLFIRLRIPEFEECKLLWDGMDDVYKNPFVNRWCAIVGNENTHTSCVYRGVGTLREINGLYYLTGRISNFYSTNTTGVCEPGALYFLEYVDKELLRWIENNEMCGSESFTCNNGQCIPLSLRCNKNEDCQDGSDEEHRFCRGLNFCPEDQFFGCGTYGPCISIDKVGDGVEDCEDGEDEKQNEKVKITIFLVIGAGVAAIFLVLILIWWRHVRKLKEQIRDLTQNEIETFKNGEMTDKNGTYDRYGLSNDAAFLPWKEEFEIPSYMFTIGVELNRGRFGIVRRGSLDKSFAPDFTIEGKEAVDAAVKTNLESLGVQEFKALLCEVKILTYIGENEHVVKCFGACTENIKKRQVHLIVEFCLNGSLKDFLVSRRNKYVDLNHFGETRIDLLADYLQPLSSQDSESDESIISTYDLLLWSTQIACGMEFLVAKKIVHCDLAARNILLTKDMNAKISDFGLSRKLEVSNVYSKAGNDPMPWKWLAVESLESNTYSEKTDVWAYGVLLWELFSLGETPYSGVSKSEHFINELNEGKRLPCPPFADQAIYNMISSCWMTKPESRPVFSALKNASARIMGNYKWKCKRSRDISNCSCKKPIITTDLDYFNVLCGDEAYSKD